MNKKIIKFRESISKIETKILSEITIWIIAIVFIGFVISLFWSGYLFTSKDINISIAGQIGDFFGGVVGSLLSFLSILYLVENLRVMQKGNLIAENKNIQEQKEKFKTFLQSKDIESLNNQFEIYFNKLKSLPNLMELSYSMTINSEIKEEKMLEFIKAFHTKFIDFEVCYSIFNLYMLQITDYLRHDLILNENQKYQLLMESIGDLDKRFYPLMNILINSKNLLENELTQIEFMSFEYYISSFDIFKNWFTKD